MRSGYHPALERGEKEGSLKKQGFYHTRAWRQIRKLALQRDRYLCQLRTSSRCTRRATEVHHVVPVDDAPALALELSNLVSCCWFCHEDTKHRRAIPSAPRGVRVIRITDGGPSDGLTGAISDPPAEGAGAFGGTPLASELETMTL